MRRTHDGDILLHVLTQISRLITSGVCELDEENQKLSSEL